MKEYKGIQKDKPTKEKGVQPYQRTPIQKDKTKLIIKRKPRHLVADGHTKSLNLSTTQTHPTSLKILLFLKPNSLQNYKEVNVPLNFISKSPP